MGMGRKKFSLPITRKMLEYPTENVSFAYLGAIGKVSNEVRTLRYRTGILTIDQFADKAIEGWISGGEPNFYGRCSTNNGYYLWHDPAATTSDHRLYTMKAEACTKIAEEAVDLDDRDEYQYWAQIVGHTFSTQRPTGEARLSVDNTDHDIGLWGIGRLTNKTGPIFGERCWLRKPSSPPPHTLTYLEVPVIGSGTEEDPFRAQMPEEIAPVPVELAPLGLRKKLAEMSVDELKAHGAAANRLALSHSSLIKTDKDGKPVDYRAIVRIFEQPDRQTHLRKIVKGIEALRGLRGVKKLKKDEAIREAKKLDDKLTDKSLKDW